MTAALDTVTPGSRSCYREGPRVAPGSGIPTGSVGIFVDGVPRANAAVDSNGQFLFVLLGGLPRARHTFKFVYTGDVEVRRQYHDSVG